jgi:vancomycin resistance protein VanW
MQKIILPLITQYESPKRKAISSRYPLLLKPAVFVKRSVRKFKNQITLSRLKKGTYLSHVIARHSSPLMRKLGDSDMRLQRNKITNLRIAIQKLDGIVIPPGKTFSLWHAVGSVTKRKGYVNGMLLSNGRVAEGLGGGLCQLSNFLFWILLHADTEVIERHHHSKDVFPDSGRTLPFGSGATIFSNYLDLKIKNTSQNPLQIKLWLTKEYLKGQILSDKPSQYKFHIVERNHCFIKTKSKYFRYNEIYREKYIEGTKISEEKIVSNFAPVLYSINEDDVRNKNQKLILI